MRTDRRVFLATSLTLLGAAGAGAKSVRHKVSTHHVRPRVLCDLPPYDYVPTLPAPSALALSMTAELLPVTGVLPGLPEVADATAAYFQLDQLSLVNGHCEISRVALMIRNDGRWMFSLRADQNRIPSEEPPVVAASPSPPRIILPGATLPSQFTAHIKRNLFIIRVRGYGAYLQQVAPDLTNGRPVLFALQLPPFWVERGLPLFRQFEGRENAFRAGYFRSVDRVEVEFTYR